MRPAISFRSLEAACRAGPSSVQVFSPARAPRRHQSTTSRQSRPPPPAQNTIATSSLKASHAEPVPTGGQGYIKPGSSSRAPIHTPPNLPRPLGVLEPPIAGPKTYVKTSDKFFDKERSKRERQALLKEASHGYFHDYNRAKRGGGKDWVAPKVLIREDKALYFPNIAGTNLRSEKTNTTDLMKGRTTLVALTSTRLSQEHTESFVRGVLDDQANNDQFNYVQINHQPNMLKGVLISFFSSSLKRETPEELWSTYLLARGEWSAIDVLEPMGIDNQIIGYVYLVDEDCKVRWAGCGIATDEEADSLRAATAVLLSRSKNANNTPP